MYKRQELNSEFDRPITHHLYGGDWENRLKQEILLGIGEMCIRDRNKSETAVQDGEEQVHIWRRSYDVAPAPVGKDDPRNPVSYTHLDVYKRQVFLWSMHCAFAAPVKYPDRDINRTRWKYIFSFYGLWTP